MRYNRYTIYTEEFGKVPSRFMCDVLDDMRKMHKTRNFSGLLGAIEQLQVMAYRMEAALGDKRTIEEYDEDAARLNRDLKDKRRQVSKMNREISLLEQKKTELEEQVKRLGHIVNKGSKGGNICCDRYADNMPCDHSR